MSVNGNHAAGQVNRETVLELVKERIRTIEERTESPKLIVNVHGLVGIGKTYLIRQIFTYFNDQAYPVILLNFDSQEQPMQQECVRSWSEVLDTLRKHPCLARIPDTIESTQGDEQSIESLAIISCESDDFEQRIDEGKPLLLLLDALDDLPYWKWVQEHVIKPLLDQQRTLVVATSQSPVFWHFWELREQSTPTSLESFSLEETQAYLHQFGKADRADEVYRITGGYPMGLDYIVHELPANPPQEIEHHYAHDMLEKLKEKLPDKIQPHFEEYLHAIVDLGDEFDLSSLRTRINAGKENSHIQPPGRINSTVTTLNSRGFFSYDPTSRRYRLHRLIRHLV
ncbi:MAG: ATP-binding protein [Chloroflexaceae bacterium]|nr:ATP-binding protein [Chloroflexaceae bacterium]